MNNMETKYFVAFIGFFGGLLFFWMLEKMTSIRDFKKLSEKLLIKELERRCSFSDVTEIRCKSGEYLEQGFTINELFIQLADKNIDTFKFETLDNEIHLLRKSDFISATYFPPKNK